MQFTPTVTKSSLLANNTSASSSFLGWPNGVAAPKHVSNVPLNIPQKKLVHRCDWWGTTSHPNIGVSSFDPAYAAKTADAMRAQGLDGCLLDWYSQGHNTDKSLLVLKPELEKRGLEFALCVDAGIPALKALPSTATDAERTTILLDALAYGRKTYFSSPSYLRDGGKPVILFFGFSTADFDWVKIRAAYSDCKLIFRWEYRPTQYGNRSYADGYFGWTDNSEEWIANVKLHAPGKLIFLGINGYFNNTVEGLPVKCTWGVGKEKVIDSRGGVRMQEQLALAAAHPEILYTSINTWNDYQEGSALEPGLASGQTLSLSFNDTPNTLSISDPGAAFDHVDLYVSKDGENLMPIPIARGTTEVSLANLGLDFGTWTFIAFGVGKPFVQDIVSNPVTIGEFVDWK